MPGKWDNWCRTEGHPANCECVYLKPDPAWVILWRKSGKPFREYLKSVDRLAA